MDCQIIIMIKNCWTIAEDILLKTKVLWSDVVFIKGEKMYQCTSNLPTYQCTSTYQLTNVLVTYQLTNVLVTYQLTSVLVTYQLTNVLVTVACLYCGTVCWDAVSRKITCELNIITTMIETIITITYNLFFWIFLIILEWKYIDSLSTNSCTEVSVICCW